MSIPPKEKQPVINIEFYSRISIRNYHLLPSVICLNLLRVVTEFL